MNKTIMLVILWNIALTAYAGIHTYVGVKVISNVSDNQQEIGVAVYDLVIWKGLTEKAN